MTSELPKAIKLESSRVYKEAMKAEKKNPYFKFYKISPEDHSINLGDCCVRAIAAAEKVTYETAEKELLEHLTKIGFGYFSKVDVDYLSENYEKKSFAAVKGQPRMNGKTFAESHKVGRYVLKMAHHLTACINGVILDTWDCTDCAVYSCWKVDGV